MFQNLTTKPFFCLQANLTHLPRSEFVPGIGLGVGKCPYDPIDNSTAIYVEQGNPGGFPALVRDENTRFVFFPSSNFFYIFIRLSSLYNLTCAMDMNNIRKFPIFSPSNYGLKVDFSLTLSFAWIVDSMDASR